MFTAHPTHQKAHEARENLESVSALQLYEEALTEYIHDDSWEGIIRVLLEKDITYQHLWFLSGKHTYLELSAHHLQMAEHTLHHHDDTLSREVHALVLFHVAKISEILDERAEALTLYQEALDLIPANTALYGNVLSHLAQSEWRDGQQAIAQEHFAMADQLLTAEHNTAEVDSKTAQAWITGSLLRQAECLVKTDPEKTRQLLQQVRQLLKSPETNPFRWQQLEKLDHAL